MNTTDITEQEMGYAQPDLTHVAPGELNEVLPGEMEEQEQCKQLQFAIPY